MIISTESNFSLTIAVGGGLGGIDDSNCVSHMKVGHSLNEIEFESSGHSSTLLAGLNHLRNKGHLTDVMLRTEDQTFNAHRAVLAACSDYFRAMFTDPMRERSQTDIFLAGVSAAGVKYLLDYIYTTRLALSLANIQDVLSAATHLQVLQVVEACSNYLQAQLDVDNCVDVVTIAETYSLHRLRRKSYRFMSENLSAFFFSSSTTTCHANLLRLSAFQLEHLLDGDFPVDVPEERVLEMLLNWLDAQPGSSRMAHAHRLLRKVNFEEIHPAHLRAVLQKKIASSLPKSFLSRVQAMSETASCGGGGGSSEVSCYASSAHLVNTRGMEQAVVKVGGFGTHGVTNQITYYLPSLDKWRHLTSVPHVECCNFGCAVIHNDLFVVGGCFNLQSLQEQAHQFGFRYSPRLNKWTTMAPMLRERCRFSLTVFGKSMFAFGGCSEDEEEEEEEREEHLVNLDFARTAMCERYDLDNDTWTAVAPFPSGHRLSQHASVRFQNLILVSGGLDHDVVLASVLAYHPDVDAWEPAARTTMPTPRADHVMLVWRDRVFFCGGWFEQEDEGQGGGGGANGGGNRSRVLVDAVDVYDTVADTWVVETRVPTPRYHAGVVIVRDKLYVIGGFHNDSLFDRATVTAAGLVECYDLEHRTWTTEKRYPQEVWEHVCVSLYIPRCREDMDVMPFAGS